MKAFIATYLIIGMIVLGVLSGIAHNRGKTFPRNNLEIVHVIAYWPYAVGLAAVVLKPGATK